MCNFSGMIKNVLPSLRQRAGPQRICSRQKSIRSGTACGSFSQTPHMRGKVTFASALHKGHGITPAHAGKSAAVSLWWASPSDHPRVCGEKFWALVRAVMALGSPPRMRGKEHVRLWQQYSPGITPACAGKRALSSSPRVALKDHPRTRQAVYKDRITPACAGKRRIPGSEAFLRRDHPRMCGEKYRMKPNRICGAGSPPHVRGKEQKPTLLPPACGITPACAGKSGGIQHLHS